MKIRQVYIRSENNEVMTTWLDDSPKLVPGAVITLKDFKQATKWTVMEVYNDQREAQDFEWHRKWDNNI